MMHRHRGPRRSQYLNKTGGSRGFTLIELMIVVAIVAIVAAVAYPSYKDSVLKGRRAEGRAALLDLLQQEERYLTQQNSYMTFSAGQSGSSGTTFASNGNVTIPFKTFSGNSSSTSAYLLGATSCTPAAGGAAPPLNECVAVFAHPVIADAAAGDLQVWSTGFKTCTGTNQSVCWK